jgi:hypothetical protein
MDQDATQPSQPLQPAESAPSPIPGAPPAKRATTGSRALNVVLGIALVLAIGGIAFAAGRLTAPPRGFANGLGPGGQVVNGKPGGDGQGKQGGLFASGGPTLEGTVESVTNTMITIKTADGQSIQVALNGSTTYHAQTDATSSDVAAGGKVQLRLDVGSFGGANGNGNDKGNGGTGGGPTARDVTVVP